ncbi:MAG TPA: YbaK/EbsC family protein [Solirubrobacteraceae bacterium]|nr:YbaK/EbsC family protein [Solirubrobacteraceae bacterium]
MSLPRSARRVQEALRAAGLDADVRELPDSTRTAPEAAAAVGTQVGAIVKSLVFVGRDSGRGVLVLVSGANRADEARIGALAGEPIDRADAEAVRALTGFSIGGVPPLGHATDMRVFVDPDLAARDVVWAAGGTPRTVFPLAGAELVRVTGGTVYEA